LTIDGIVVGRRLGFLNSEVVGRLEGSIDIEWTVGRQVGRFESDRVIGLCVGRKLGLFEIGRFDGGLLGYFVIRNVGITEGNGVGVKEEV